LLNVISLFLLVITHGHSNLFYSDCVDALTNMGATLVMG